MAERLRRFALRLLASLRRGSGSNPMRGTCICQLLTEGCCFTPGNNVFLQLWKLTATCVYTLIGMKKNDVTHKHHLTYHKLIPETLLRRSTIGQIILTPVEQALVYVTVTEWLRRFALKLLSPLRCSSGSNPMNGCC